MSHVSNLSSTRRFIVVMVTSDVVMNNNSNNNNNNNNSLLILIIMLRHRPVHDDQLDVDVLAILVQEVGHEVGHGLVRDVSAQDDVSAMHTQHTTHRYVNDMGFMQIAHK